MKISVVIPAYNGWRYLKQYLPAVLSLGADEVIVVDDASSDCTSENLHAHFPDVHVITHTKNSRFPKSVNDGFAAASGECVILLNQDVKPDSKLINCFMPFFKNPDIFAVSLNEEGNAWADAKFSGGFLNYFNGQNKPSSHPSFWASGGSAVFRRDLWKKLGGFDTTFSPGYFEDLDLGWRAWKSGYQIVWSKAAKVFHERETAFKKAFSSDELTHIKERNFLLVHWKNLDSGKIPSHIFAVCRRLVRHPGYVRPLLAALARLPHILVARRQVSRLWQRTDQQILSLLHTA